MSIFLKGGAALDKSDYKPKPNADWLVEKMWINILALSLHSFTNEGINFFKNLPDQISNNIEVWKKWAYEKTDPENHPIPEYEERIKNDQEIGSFLRLLLIRCFREDRTLTACDLFIEDVLGEQRYIQPVNDSMESILDSSNKTVPILFLLSAGADPTSSIDEMARKKKQQLSKVSLGEG